MIARYKPGCQIIGCTLDEKVYRQLNLLWGVKPVMIQKERTTDALFEEAVFKAKQAGLVKTADTVVITAGVPLGVVGKTDMIHVVGGIKGSCYQSIIKRYANAMRIKQRK